MTRGVTMRASVRRDRGQLRERRRAAVHLSDLGVAVADRIGQRGSRTPAAGTTLDRVWRLAPISVVAGQQDLVALRSMFSTRNWPPVTAAHEPVRPRNRRARP